MLTVIHNIHKYRYSKTNVHLFII
uniref:Uncharacterized protein n=1 Tax=Anguilla anguilla TaxID=7936 RepID=A0A0E9QQR0_ANGAN